jgi:hypothetical protein
MSLKRLKNVHTHTSARLEGFGLMRKQTWVCTMILFFVMAFAGNANGQPPPHPPLDHNTLGQIDTGPILFDATYTGSFWKYDFSAINCQGITLWTFITILPKNADGSEGTPYLVNYSIVNWTGDDEIDVIKLRQIADLGDNQAFFVTHISFRLVVNGILTDGVVYPQGGWNNIRTSLDPPCDCVGFFPNPATKTVYAVYGQCY